jgi:hypothetical protein
MRPQFFVFCTMILLLCSPSYSLGAEESGSQVPTKLQRMIKPLEKYLRSRQVNVPGSKKAPARRPRREIKVLTQSKPSLETLHEVQQSYYQDLFSIYENTLDTFRFFLDFLKETKSMSLKELKVRIQQLQGFLSEGSENMVQIRRRLRNISAFLTELIREGNSAAIEHIDGPHYSQLLNFQARLDLEKEAIETLIEKLATLKLFHWNRFHDRLQGIVDSVEKHHAFTWKRTLKSPVLQEQPELVRRIKKDLQETGGDLKLIRNHFVYTEARMLKRFAQIEPIQFPASSSNGRAAERSFIKTFEALEWKLRSRMEQEKVEIVILEANLKQGIRIKDPTLQMIPLSQHLFFNHTLEKKPGMGAENSQNLILPKSS